jgi:biopolymer transport protein TolQ
LNIFKIFLESSFAAQIIMVILIIFSIWSWAVLFKKLYDLGLVQKRGQSFLSAVRFYKKIREYENLGHMLTDNPFGRILAKGVEEYKSLKVPGIPPHPKILELAENIRFSMEQVKIAEVEKLEGGLAILSTIVTASPFLGLLGTTLGVMEAFFQVRARGSAHITVVAPGISDALITTVWGLAVALPALVFNNYLRSRLNKLDSHLDKFITETFIKFRRSLIEPE